jgi:beta-lactamase class A
MRLPLILVLLVCSSLAQTPLQQHIHVIAARSDGKVSVACALPDSSLNCDLNPHAHPPMQSVFKLPMAVTTLHMIEQGKLSLDQSVRFLASDRILPQTWSPLQDKYPQAEVDVPLRELLRLAIVESDNTAADMVLRTIGGPSVVDEYIRTIGVSGFHLQDDEHGLHRDVKIQYRNWFEPAGAVQLLRRLSDNSPLTPEHSALLFGWMKECTTGAHRIKGQLPAGTVVMHKTGSAAGKGMAYATNDIGLITLPDGRQLAIAVFITDSKANETARESIIARIARAAYDEGVKK